MRCPWPAVRLAKALRGGAKTVTVIADDPNAPTELASVATAAKAKIEIVLDEVSPTFVVTLR
jgi:tRNA 2-thiouridine synthesizing protein A